MRIAIVQGHPDPDPARLCRGLAAAYTRGAAAAGHELRIVDVAALTFTWLRTKTDFDSQPPPQELAAAQEALGWAEHWVLIYPLWLGGMPAMLKGFLEQIARPGFAFELRPGGSWKAALRGKSARVIVTMGMPAAVYRWWFRAHSLKSLERNILRFVGVKPVRATLIGAVDGLTTKSAAKWLRRAEELGRRGA